jgi:hypothetical protein
MSDTRIIHIAFPNIYRYGGFTFEFHPYLGPSKLNKDWNPSVRPAGEEVLSGAG